MFINPNPNCNNNCKFIFSEKVVETIIDHIVYDKKGNIITNNCKKITQRSSCLKCSKSWLIDNNMGDISINSLG